MENAFKEIEAAIVEVKKARQLVSRNKSKQVSGSDEIDRLKSVAYAWFQTHRALVLAHPSRPDLAAVDAAYRTVMGATGRRAARTTYAAALQAAQQSLVQVRAFVATMPNSLPGAASLPKTTDAPPSFAPLCRGPGMQAILERRWNEVQQCTGAEAYLAATVMMGGLLESLLLARINASANTAAIFTAKHAPRDSGGHTFNLRDWKLAHMVDVAHELAWITKSARDVGHVLRDFRNYIHPHKEHTDNVVISADDARIFWEVTKAISRQVLASVGRSP